MSAVSAVFVLDARGRVLIYRDYRGDVSPRHAERFMLRLAEDGGEDGGGSLPPVLHDDGVSCVHLPHGNVHFLAVTRGNCNAAAAVVFLRHLVAVFRHYFGEVEEESVRDNFVTVYELLDEVMDHGWPQFTEARILSEYIRTDAHRLLEPLGIVEAARPPMAVTNAVSWRSEGVRHKKNEVFLDVVESVSMVVGGGGQVVVSEVQGTLKMRAYLSGMPECKLGLNDKVLFEAQGRAARHRAVDLEDARFHQCVRLARFDNDRTISFIPPDGAFDLMTYRLSLAIKPLVTLDVRVDRPSRSRVEYTVKARSHYKERSTATNVEIALPLPADCTAPVCRATSGAAAYVPERSSLVWSVKQFPGGREFTLRCHFNLPSVEADDGGGGGGGGGRGGSAGGAGGGGGGSLAARAGFAGARMPPAKVTLELPYYTASGLVVRYLRVVEKSGYQALPWVRYITSSTAEFRI